jgi:hypothetical protein
VTERIEIRHHFSPLVERIDREGDNLDDSTPGPHAHYPLPHRGPIAPTHLMFLEGHRHDPPKPHHQLAGVRDNDLNATEAIDYYLGRFCYGRLLEWDITARRGELSCGHPEPRSASYGPNETETPPQDLASPPLCPGCAARVRGHDPRVSRKRCGRMVLSSPAIALLGRPDRTPRKTNSPGRFAPHLWRFGFLEDALQWTESPGPEDLAVS